MSVRETKQQHIHTEGSIFISHNTPRERERESARERKREIEREREKKRETESERERARERDKERQKEGPCLRVSEEESTCR